MSGNCKSAILMVRFRWVRFSQQHWLLVSGIRRLLRSFKNCSSTRLSLVVQFASDRIFCFLLICLFCFFFFFFTMRIQDLFPCHMKVWFSKCSPKTTKAQRRTSRWMFPFTLICGYGPRLVWYFRFLRKGTKSSQNPWEYKHFLCHLECDLNASGHILNLIELTCKSMCIMRYRKRA